MTGVENGSRNQDQDQDQDQAERGEASSGQDEPVPTRPGERAYVEGGQVIIEDEHERTVRRGMFERI